MNSTHNIDTFYLLDLDRTLFNTAEMTKQIFAIAGQHDASIASELERKAEEDFQRGYPFAIREELEKKFGPEKTDKIEQTLLAQVQPATLLLPNALESIDFAQESPINSCGILTYGEVRGQTMKLKATRLTHVPYIITAKREKGQLMQSWLQDNDTYQLPEEYNNLNAHQLVLVDDRLFSFQGIPSSARGYWVTPQTPTAAEISVLPANVTPVQSLSEFIECERHLDKT
jgi:hypothetical protein